MQYDNIEQVIEDLKQRIANTSHAPTRQALENQLAQLYQGQQLQSPYNKMGNLGDDLLNPNSALYQNFASYLQKTQGGIGANTLLAPLMAGGAGYAGGQALSGQQRKESMLQRQDKINTGVQGFALQNIGTAAGLYGQQGQLGLGIANLNENRRQFDESQKAGMLGSLGGGLGSILGTLFAPGIGTAIGGAIGSGASPNRQNNAVAGYGG